jgi:hypothetical protein
MTWPKIYHMHSSEFYWNTVVIKVGNHFSAPIDHRPYHDPPRFLRTCSFYLPDLGRIPFEGVGTSVKITLEHVYISSKIVTNVFPPTQTQSTLGLRFFQKALTHCRVNSDFRRRIWEARRSSFWRASFHFWLATRSLISEKVAWVRRELGD